MSNGKNRELIKKYYIIYKITNLVNGKIYIGFHSTNIIEDGYLGSGKAIKRAIKKYGEENFYKEILEIFNNKEDAEQCEAELVNEEFVNRKDTYNITVGGNVCILGGENNGFYGKIHTEETIEKIQESISGYKPTEETKKKISEGLKKSHSNPEVKKKISEGNKGKIIPEETRIKISKANKGKVISEETKKKSSVSKKKRFNDMTEEEYGEGYDKTFTEERRKKLSDSQKGRKCPWNEITNKDPEKIRKTAETHRGMKRSDQAKKNISEGMKGKPALNKGSVGCYNPTTNERKMIDNENNIPDGWVKGQGKKSTPKGKIYCHDPETNKRKMCYPQNIPEGGIRGMGKKKGSR